MRTKFRLPWSAYELKLERLNQTALGQEVVDDTPMAPPIGYVKQPSMVEHIRNMVRSEQLRLAAEAEGQESFEEAEDFDVEDEPEPISAYEWEPSFEPQEVYKVTPSASPLKSADEAPPSGDPAPGAPAPDSKST